MKNPEIQMSNGIGYYDPASGEDSCGSVFHFKNGIYRAINISHVDSIRTILSFPNIQDIFNAGLIKTSISNLYSPLYGLILQHEKIEFLSYFMEWTPHMFRDAALMLVNVGIELARNKYQLIDCHPYNIFFNFTDPKYIDFGSIKPFGNGIFPAQWAGHFRDNFAKRLQTFSNLTVEQFLELRNNISDPFEFFKEIKAWLESAEFTYPITEWSGYGQKSFGKDLPPKQRVFIEEIEKGLPTTLHDIGSNMGLYSMEAERRGYKVVASDIDQVTLTKLYLHSKENNLRILPLVLDISNPTKAHGTYTDGFRASTERLVCDVTVVLALLHHVVIKQKITFLEITKQLADYTRRTCIVEWIPAEDRHIAGWNIPSDYTRENFISKMLPYFEAPEIKASNPTPREILVFKRRV